VHAGVEGNGSGSSCAEEEDSSSAPQDPAIPTRCSRSVSAYFQPKRKKSTYMVGRSLTSKQRQAVDSLVKN
jgi:hypothetical protein